MYLRTTAFITTLVLSYNYHAYSMAIFNLGELDRPLLIETIRQGRVYQHPNFLTEDQVQLLLHEIQELQESGKFTRSGLSNNAKKENRFGEQDRSVCVVPWWQDSLHAAATDDVHEHPLSSIIQNLRLSLANVLDRPTMKDSSLAHECYYSCGGVGSFLPRHMDERHEELKGTKGWILPSRRSLSWLIYLSDEGWELDRNGGALRTYPPSHVVHARGSVHEDNLQAGWFHTANGAVEVYLDSWFRLDNVAEPHCVLYMVNSQGERTFLTKPWLNDALQAMSGNDFLRKWAEHDSLATPGTTLFTERKYADNFSLLEDREAWDLGEVPPNSATIDISPLRASLVVFDSVSLPHQVELVQEGTRIAMAGWLHERTQSFPADLYTEDADAEL